VIHERWAAVAALEALVPASRFYTGASFDAELPLAVVIKKSQKPSKYQSDGSVIDIVVLEFHVLHAQYDAAAEIIYQIKKAFDNTTFNLSGSDQVQSMKRVNDYEQLRDDGTWEMILDFTCTVYLASGA
jgi:hypothetical protein